MVDFSKLRRCTDLRGDHIAAAARSSEAITALVRRFAEIARPNSGGTLILAALARLGTSSCDFIDGELRIELLADGTKTKIMATSSLGGGFREAVFPAVVLDVPLTEFVRMIEKSPKVIEPLSKSMSANGIVLTATEEVRLTSLPPPMIQIDASSLLDVDIPKMPKLSAPFELDEPDDDSHVGPLPKAKGELVVRKPTKQPPSSRKTTKPPPKVPRPAPKKS
jgi:hypothetical protein